jgi:hypothetical protein
MTFVVAPEDAVKSIRTILFVPEVLFYSLCYVPFSYSLLIHSFWTREATDPSTWASDPPKYSTRCWILGTFFFFCGLAMCFILPLLFHPANTLLLTAPMLILTIIFHAFTYDYVLQRPELCTIKLPVQTTGIWERVVVKRIFHIQNLHNWVAVLSCAVEWAQLCAVAYSTSVPWFANNDNRNPPMQPIRDGFEAFMRINNTSVCFYFCALFISFYAFLVGILVRKSMEDEAKKERKSQGKLHPDLLESFLFEFMAGACFLTVFSALLQVLTSKDTKERKMVTFLGLLILIHGSVRVHIQARGSHISEERRELFAQASCGGATYERAFCLHPRRGSRQRDGTADSRDCAGSEPADAAEKRRHVHLCFISLY